MATARKPDRGSLSRRDPSLAARAASRASTAVETVASVGPSTGFDGSSTRFDGSSARFDGPSTELLNKLLLALGIRALVTGIALTFIAPTVPVFVGVNLLLGAPVVARYLYRRRAAAGGRRLGRDPSPSLFSRLSSAVRGLADRSLRSSRDSDRL